MISAPSYESLAQQVESLKKELAQCSNAGQLARENEFKYRRILESSSEGFILLDRNQKITEVNNALMKVSGYSRQDFLSQPIKKFYDKATVDFFPPAGITSVLKRHFILWTVAGFRCFSAAVRSKMMQAVSAAICIF